MQSMLYNNTILPLLERFLSSFYRLYTRYSVLVKEQTTSRNSKDESVVWVLLQAYIVRVSKCGAYL